MENTQWYRLSENSQSLFDIQSFIWIIQLHQQFNLIGLIKLFETFISNEFKLHQYPVLISRYMISSSTIKKVDDRNLSQLKLCMFLWDSIKLFWSKYRAVVYCLFVMKRMIDFYYPRVIGLCCEVREQSSMHTMSF